MFLYNFFIRSYYYNLFFFLMNLCLRRYNVPKAFVNYFNIYNHNKGMKPSGFNF